MKVPVCSYIGALTRYPFQEADSDSTSEEEGRHISSSRAQSAPEARLIMKNFQKSVLGLALGNRPLIVSLNAKLNAWPGHKSA